VLAAIALGAIVLVPEAASAQGWVFSRTASDAKG